MQPNRSNVSLGSSILDSTLDIRFKNAKHGLVPSDRHLQDAQESLCRMPAGNNSPVDNDRMGRSSYWLRVQPEINQQFFGRAGNATKIGINRFRVPVIDLDLDLSRGRG
jgi:hypothetical protein